MPKAGDIYRDEGIREYEPRAYEICRNFRILLEKMIEHVLTQGVVLRYRRAIQTQGRLDRLALINECDCQLLERLMTKYSKYMHSQSFEAIVAHPTPDELQLDLQELKKWFDNFNNRVKN